METQLADGRINGQSDAEISRYDDDSKEGLLETEDELLAAFLSAATQRSQTAKVIIRRDGKNVFAFRIQPLSESDFQRIRDYHTKTRSDNRLKINIPIDTDTVRYRTHLIYEATTPSDRRLLWDNYKAQEAAGVLIAGMQGGQTTAFDLIDRMLLAGEKDAIINRIEEISGYGTEVALQEKVKN